MSLALLLEKYDVSTDEGLQKALGEIENEECEVDEALIGAMARSSSLEGRLRAASQAYGRLGEVRADALAAADMVHRTADLARDVSAKVRQLDLARSRVSECQHRVHDLLELQVCVSGVQTALRARDFAAGAAHVARFRQLDPRALAAARARGVPDPREDMARAAQQLREHLDRKFDEAARKQDDAAIERLIKLFPQLGCAEEGVDLLAKYIATQAEATIRRVSAVPDASSEAAVFADAFTRLLEAGGAAVERARTLATAPGLLPRALGIIQPAVCAGGRRLWAQMRAARRLETAPPDPRRAAAPAAPPPLSPLAAEHALAELALAHSRLKLYFAFLRRKTESDAAPLPEPARAACVESTEKIVSECELTRVAQDMLAQYLALERYFLEESVTKALKMATAQPGATTSSLVDDVFFIARKVIRAEWKHEVVRRRSVSTGSLDGACAALNDVCAAVERAATALRGKLRSPPADTLPLPPPPAAAAAEPAPLLGQRLNRDLDTQRALFLAHMNEAESGAEWAERLAAAACEEAEPLLRGAGGAAGRGKLRACAGGLAGAAAAFRAATELAAAGLRAALQPRLAAWADRLASPGDDEDVENEADALPAALDVLLEAARAALPLHTADALLVAAIGDLAARAEARLLHHHYRREGGLLVERRARRLTSWAGSVSAAARERCARLTQAAALLALEVPAHARDALLPTARLAPAAARDILARRTDFKIEDIKRLKL